MYLLHTAPAPQLLLVSFILTGLSNNNSAQRLPNTLKETAGSIVVTAFFGQQGVLVRDGLTLVECTEKQLKVRLQYCFISNLCRSCCNSSLTATLISLSSQLQRPRCIIDTFHCRVFQYLVQMLWPLVSNGEAVPTPKGRFLWEVTRRLADNLSST
jgi:hypothetical protein